METGGPKYWNLTDTVNAKMIIERKGGFNRANPIALCLDAKQGAVSPKRRLLGLPRPSQSSFRWRTICQD